MAIPPPDRRLWYIEHLRVLLVTLVVLHHVGQAYGGAWWYYDDISRERWLGPFFVVNRSFFMSLFFMVSGYFMPASFDRKGSRRFLIDRLRRLGIPLAVFFFVMIPVMMYAHYVYFRPYGTPSFGWYYIHIYFGAADKPPDWSGPSWPDLQFAHLWFVQHLLLAAIGYAVWRWLRGGPVDPQRTPKPPPRTWKIVAFAGCLSIVTFVVRIGSPIDQWTALLGFIQVAFADVPRDLSFFLIGVAAYRYDWFQRISARAGRNWLVVAAACAALLWALALNDIPCFAGGGTNPLGLIYTTWEAVFCCGACIGLTVLFREKLNAEDFVARTLGPCTYGVYLFHVPILVPMQYAVGPLAVPAIVKFAIVSALSLPASFVFVHYVRKLPGVRRVL